MSPPSLPPVADPAAATHARTHAGGTRADTTGGSRGRNAGAGTAGATTAAGGRTDAPETGTRTTAAEGRTDAPATGTRTTGSSAGDASCGIGNCGISHQHCRGAVMRAWPLQVESNPGMCCVVPRTSGCVVCLQNIQKGGVVAQSDRYASQRFHLASIHSSWKACTHKTHTSGALCLCGPLGRVIHDRFHGEH